jgi:hypothetical protein
MGRVGNRGWTQRYARMWYVVTGLVPARIEVRPSNGLGALDTPTLPAVYPRDAVTDMQLVYKMDLQMRHALLSTGLQAPNCRACNPVVRVTAATSASRVKLSPGPSPGP